MSANDAMDVDSKGSSNTQDAKAPSPNYKLRFILSGHTSSISSIKFSPDGSLLASAGAPIHLPDALFVPMSWIEGKVLTR
jgi:COMPASS component SWD3